MLAEQKPNLSYIDSTEHSLLADALLDPEVFKGNKVQQLKSQAEAIQKKLQEVADHERDKALASLNDLKGNMESFEQFAKLSLDQQQTLVKSFEQVSARIVEQQLIAVVRDDLRRFEDETHSKLIAQLMQWSKPAPVTGQAKGDVTTSTGSESEHQISEPEPVESIQARQIKVPFDKPWLESEHDVDNYVERYKEVLMVAIKQGKQVQL